MERTTPTSAQTQQDKSLRALRTRARGGLVWRQNSRQTPLVLLVLPSTQKWPWIHGPVHSRLFKPRDAPYRPAAQGVGVEEPRAHA
eukprot:1912304-Prymnesium_polylepis.1